jgi:hypothetical protein
LTLVGEAAERLKWLSERAGLSQSAVVSHLVMRMRDDDPLLVMGQGEERQNAGGRA